MNRTHTAPARRRHRPREPPSPGRPRCLRALARLVQRVRARRRRVGHHDAVRPQGSGERRHHRPGEHLLRRRDRRGGGLPARAHRHRLVLRALPGRPARDQRHRLPDREPRDRHPQHLLRHLRPGHARPRGPARGVGQPPTGPAVPHQWRLQRDSRAGGAHPPRRHRRHPHPRAGLAPAAGRRRPEEHLARRIRQRAPGPRPGRPARPPAQPHHPAAGGPVPGEARSSDTSWRRSPSSCPTATTGTARPRSPWPASAPACRCLPPCRSAASTPTATTTRSRPTRCST